MITKERLEELIKQGATIYHLIAKNYEEINANDIPQYKLESWELYKEYYFETEEDARWELEMTATRMETLKLPTWEDFTFLCDIMAEYSVMFRNADGTDYMLYRLNDIVVYNRSDSEFEFEKPPTKENYIEACKLCLRLFKG